LFARPLTPLGEFVALGLEVSLFGIERRLGATVRLQLRE
jgi:hypothetical protein